MANKRFKLKAAIVAKYGSQANFAKKMGLDESTVSRLINKRRLISAMAQKRWAARLDCDVDEIFDI